LNLIQERTGTANRLEIEDPYLENSDGALRVVTLF
jgi:hypothetical protein